LALFLGQDFTAVDSLPVSRIDALYESDAYKAWKQARDNALRLPGALFGRIDGLSKQIRGLAQAVSPR